MHGADGSFDFTEARFLSPHLHGWNEFSLQLLGGAAAGNPGAERSLLRINGEVERVQISSGRIRFKSSYMSGNAALTALRNRRERILALCEWVDGSSVKSGIQAFHSEKEFKEYWERLLFPELVSKNLQPAEYTTINAEWNIADNVRWNRTYTQFLFPEYLWEYRNTGALLRDWEEALPWIYFEYSWNIIIESFNETVLLKR
jgi:hypothetical protein